jgi:hypothetical protein
MNKLSKQREELLLIHHGFLGGKNPSHGPGALPGALPFRVACGFLGLFSPVAVAMVRTSALSPNASAGRDRTGSRHVGHVKVGFAGMY